MWSRHASSRMHEYISKASTLCARLENACQPIAEISSWTPARNSRPCVSKDLKRKNKTLTMLTELLRAKNTVKVSLNGVMLGEGTRPGPIQHACWLIQPGRQHSQWIKLSQPSRSYHMNVSIILTSHSQSWNCRTWSKSFAACFSNSSIVRWPLIFFSFLSFSAPPWPLFRLLAMPKGHQQSEDYSW